MPPPSHVNAHPKLPHVAGTSSSEHGESSSTSPPRSPTRETPNFSRPLPVSLGGRSTASPTGPVAVAQGGRSTPSSPRPLPSVPEHHSRRSPEHSQGGRGSGLGTRIIDDRDPDDIVPPPLARGSGYGQAEDDQTSTAASDSELLYASAPSTPLRVPIELEGEGGDDTIRVSGRDGGQRELPERRVTVALGEAAHDDRRADDSITTTPRRAATTDYDLRGLHGKHIPGSFMPTHEATGRQGSSRMIEELQHDDDTNLRTSGEQLGNTPIFPKPHVQGWSTSSPSFPDPQPHQHGSQSQPVLAGFRVNEPRTSVDSEAGYHSDNNHRAAATVSIPSPVSFPTPFPQRQDTSWRSSPLSTHSVQSSRQAVPVPQSSSLIAGTNLQFEPFSFPHDRDSNADADVNNRTYDPTQLLRPLSPSPVAKQESGDSVTPLPSIIHGATEMSHRETGSSLSSHTMGDNANATSRGSTPVAPLRIIKHTHPAGTSSGATTPTRGDEHVPPRQPLSAVTSTEEARKPSLDSATVTAATPEAAAKQSQTPFSLPIQAERPQAGTSTSTSVGPSSPKPLKPVLKKINPASGQGSRLQKQPPGRPVDQDQARPTPTPPKSPGPEKEGSGVSSVPADGIRQAQTQSQLNSQVQDQQGKSQSRPSSRSHPQPPQEAKPPPNHVLPLAASPPPRTVGEEKAQYNSIPSSARSQYMKMLLALDDIPTIFDLAASFSTWILLAGFILFPGTFTSLQNLNLGNGVGAELVNTIVNLPLFVVAFVCTGIGVAGMGYLWWRWMHNYIWIVNKIFLPGFLNSVAGIISTLANVYGVQHGEFNTNSITTISVTGGVAVVTGILTLWYGVLVLGRIKERHRREMGIAKAGKHGEGVWAGFKARMK